MSYKGQPFPSTVVDSGARAKISDGLSVKVEVTGPAKYNAGELAEIEGFLGFIVQNVDIASGVTEEVILNIEQAEYETDQIDPPVTGDNDFEYKVGTLLYWDGEQLTEDEDDGEVSAEDGAKASGKTTVDSVEVTVEADEKKAVYNGVTIKFEAGATAGSETTVWNGKKLTVGLADATSYTHTALNTLIQAATDGAPSGVNAAKLIIKTSITKTGAQWVAADDVVLADGEDEDDGEVSPTAYRVAGRVTSAVDKNNVIWMILAPQV